MNKSVDQQLREVKIGQRRLNRRMEFFENTYAKDRATMFSELPDDQKKMIIEDALDEIRTDQELLETKMDNLERLMDETRNSG